MRLGVVMLNLKCARHPHVSTHRFQTPENNFGGEEVLHLWIRGVVDLLSVRASTFAGPPRLGHYNNTLLRHILMLIAGPKQLSIFNSCET